MPSILADIFLESYEAEIHTVFAPDGKEAVCISVQFHV